MKKEGDKELDVCLAVSGGDREALSCLFTEYYSSLYNYGLRIIHNDHEIVKDSIQELFLSIWINREKMAHVKSIHPYLFSALRLTIYDHIRRQKARTTREEQYYNESDSGLFNVEEIMIHFEIKKENEERLKILLEKLSKRKKEAIYLKFFRGFSNGEVSEIMGISIQSVYNLISEAIDSLQDLANRQD